LTTQSKQSTYQRLLDEFDDLPLIEKNLFFNELADKMKISEDERQRIKNAAYIDANNNPRSLF